MPARRVIGMVGFREKLHSHVGHASTLFIAFLVSASCWLRSGTNSLNWRARPNDFPLEKLLLVFFLATASAIFASDGLAATGKRVALVIGNGNYNIAPKLDNPVADATAVAAVFKRLGFQVTEGYDQSIAQMRSTLSEFTNSLAGSDVAIVYFAGHGVSVDDENYLLPTDIELKTPTDLDLNTIDVALILRQLRREERVNILILDACRSNPFALELGRAKTRAVIAERGLAPIEGNLVRGSLIAFATDPKSAAFDGRPGEHSPFTKALLDHLEDADVSIETVMARVRSEVWEGTKNQQLPWVNTALIGEFDLNPKRAIASEPPPAPVPTASSQLAAPAPPAERQATENLFWESIQHSNLVSDYQAYLDAFPNGIFAPMARNRIAALSPLPVPAKAVSTAAAEPPTAVGALKSEVGTEETEKSLNLGLAERKELQRRLSALELDPGPPDGELGEKARLAIREWQNRSSLTPSGFLGPLQYAALKSESEGILHESFPIPRVDHPQLVRPPLHEAAPPPVIRRVDHTQLVRLPMREAAPPPEKREPVRARLEQRAIRQRIQSSKESPRQVTPSGEATPVRSNSGSSSGSCPSGYDEVGLYGGGHGPAWANTKITCVPRGG